MNRVVAEAQSWIGTPYVHQATFKGRGCDCLGLIRGVWRATVGKEPSDVPTYTPDWSEPGGQEQLMAAASLWLDDASDAPWEAGQVLLFRMRGGAVAKHLGILSNAGAEPRFIHAYSAHGVIESPLSEPWRRKVVARYAFPLGD